MSDTQPEQIAVEPPRRHRWARRELWFVVVAVLAVVAVFAVYRHHPSQHVAPGAPIGGVPTPSVPAVPVPHTPATSTSAPSGG